MASDRQLLWIGLLGRACGIRDLHAEAKSDHPMNLPMPTWAWPLTTPRGRGHDCTAGKQKAGWAVR